MPKRVLHCWKDRAAYPPLSLAGLVAANAAIAKLPPPLRIEVSSLLPIESTDPERPGWVHAIKLSAAEFHSISLFREQPECEVLLISPAAWKAWKLRAFRAKARAWFRSAP